MDKLIKTIIVSAVALLVAVPALAATEISLSPAIFNIKQGQIFQVNISVSPQGVKNYTVKTQLKYPATTLEVTGFTFGNAWTPLNQAGYDLTDNTNGTLIKTAGYPNGVSTDVVFGTVTFRAKQNGTATISVGAESLALDENSQNVYSGIIKSTSVTIASGVVITPTPVTTPTPAVATTDTNEDGSDTVSENENDIVAEDSNQASLMANLGNFVSLGTGNWFLAILVVLAIAYGAYWIIKRKLKK